MLQYFPISNNQKIVASFAAFHSAESCQAPLLISLHPLFNCDLWPLHESALIWLPAAAAAGRSCRCCQEKHTNTFIVFMRHTSSLQKHTFRVSRGWILLQKTNSFHIHLFVFSFLDSPVLRFYLFISDL